MYINFGINPDWKYQADTRQFMVFGEGEKQYFGFSYRGIRIVCDYNEYEKQNLTYIKSQINSHQNLQTIMEQESKQANEKLYQMIGLESKFNDVAKFLDENQVESILRLSRIKQAPKFWVKFTTKKKEVQKLEAYLNSFKGFHKFVMDSVQVGYEIPDQFDRTDICPTYEKSLDELVDIQENILYLQTGIINTAENKIKSFERLKVIF